MVVVGVEGGIFDPHVEPGGSWRKIGRLDRHRTCTRYVGRVVLCIQVILSALSCGGVIHQLTGLTVASSHTSFGGAQRRKPTLLIAGGGTAPCFPHLSLDVCLPEKKIRQTVAVKEHCGVHLLEQATLSLSRCPSGG